MSITQRDYTDPGKQYAARIAGYDQRLQNLERGKLSPTGSGGGGPAINQVVSTRAHLGSNFTVATINTPVAITYGVEDWDTANAYNPSTGIFTVPIAGKYRVVHAALVLSGGVNQYISAFIKKNGTITSNGISATMASGASTYPQGLATDTIDCAVGDQIAFAVQVVVASSVEAHPYNSFIAIDLLPGVGPPGPIGPTGAAGPQGPIGTTGPTGATGNPGPQGPTGTAAGFGAPTATANGLAAGAPPTAAITPSGPDTAKVFGFTFGIPAGATGAQGPQGATGAQGPIGNTGPQGPIGNTGAQGSTGPQGPTGPAAGFGAPTAAANGLAAGAAPTAAIAASGPDTAKIFGFTFGIPAGATGATGPQGPIGNTGAQGPQGPNGPQGPIGNPGTAAGFGTPTAAANGLAAGAPPTAAIAPSGPDTAKVFAFTFGIPAGATGAQGPQGPNGATGPVGPTGPTGPQGPGISYAITQTTPPDQTNPIVSPPQGLLWIDDSSAIDTQYARGLIASAIGPAAQTDYGATATNAVSVNANLIAGRTYRVSAQALGSQQTATGTPQALLTDNGGYIAYGNVRVFYWPSLIATVAVTGHGDWIFTATATATIGFSITVSSNAGVVRFGANSCQIAVEDIGGS